MTEDVSGDNSLRERIDAATARRLRALRTMPVDVSRLARGIESEVPRPTAAATRRAQPARRLPWLSPLRAVAASLLVLGAVAALIIASSSGPALASTDRLLAVHQAVVSGQDHAVPVQSIEGANDALSRHWPDAPALPSVRHDEVMSCCVHRVGRRKVACAAMKIDGVAVSMAVADASDIRMPEGQKIERDGGTYHVQSAKGINMAMTERNGRWACLMGPLPVDRLLEALDTLRW
jgi:hypothetical protein